MRESMWSLLGIPESGKRALLECGRQVYATVRGEYEVQLRWDLERLDEMMGNGEASVSLSLSLSLPWRLSLSSKDRQAPGVGWLSFWGGLF